MKVLNNDNEFPIVRNLTEAQIPPLKDEASGSITYYGWAPMGTAEDAASWKIMRVQKTGNVTKSEFPDSNNGYSFKWSERATLTYTR